MVGALENVVKLGNVKVYEEIQRFLDKKFLISESNNTRQEYERDIRQFFHYLTNGRKEIEHLTINDIQLTQDDIEDYQLYLVNLNKYANTTINRKIVPVKELYKRFERRQLVEDISMFSDIKRLKEKENPYGILSVDEVYQILEYIKNRPRSKKRTIKYHLIRFAVETRARIEECLSVKWSNFEIKGDDVIIHIVAKGNKDFKPRIAKWFYDELLELKVDGIDYVFDISKTGVQDMMNDINNGLEIPKERHITFHSWRKTGATFLFQLTKDLEYTRKSLNHSSIVTTQRYIQGVDYGIHGMFSMEKDYDQDLYKKTSHELLLEAIESLEPAERMRVNMKLNEIINKK